MRRLPNVRTGLRSAVRFVDQHRRAAALICVLAFTAAALIAEVVPHVGTHVHAAHVHGVHRANTAHSRDAMEMAVSDDSVMYGGAQPRMMNKMGRAAVAPAPAGAETFAFVGQSAPADMAFAPDAGVGGSGSGALGDEWLHTAADPTATSDMPELRQRMIIRDVNLDLFVRSVPEFERRVTDLVNKIDGFVVSASQYTAMDGTMHLSLHVRIPQTSLDASLEQIRAAATFVRHTSSSGRDVSEEYVDLRARTQTLQATYAQLTQLMRRAEQVSDVLAVQSHLERVTSQIESQKARMQYLQRASALSSVHISAAVDPQFVPRPEPPPQPRWYWNPLESLMRALSLLGRVAYHLADAAIIGTVFALPVFAGFLAVRWLSGVAAAAASSVAAPSSSSSSSSASSSASARHGTDTVPLVTATN